jgi:hypothetical protein
MTNMENLQIYLENLRLSDLINLSKESEATSFSEDSPIREIINTYYANTETQFHVSLISLKLAILQEITERFYNRGYF